MVALTLFLSLVKNTLFPDTDGDGIQDRWDACIDEPENFNGILDWDGLRRNIQDLILQV